MVDDAERVWVVRHAPHMHPVTPIDVAETRIQTLRRPLDAAPGAWTRKLKYANESIPRFSRRRAGVR